MDVEDDADGSLDPRIQIELENLNNATDDINKLETLLDEAHTAFRQLLSESTKRLKEIADKLGSSCIEKARCYYEALDAARQAQVKCQLQAQLFQRASEIHAAAKETVALAEARFMSHQHEWNFDQAWQDMLNHATIKVMDAENQKAECGREHHRRALLFHDAEKRLFELEEKHRRSIIKAQPYFEIRAQCDQMLSTQKERVECLQKAIKDAKRNYATSLRTLEEISNQIHQQRRDYDFVANGPREPGVGAELVTPEKSLNYEMEFNQLNNNRTNPVPGNQHGKELRTQTCDNTCQAKEGSEHLDKRSVDGSEATSSQWELELQVSMENLNNLSVENSVYESDHEGPNKMSATNVAQQSSASFSPSKELPTYTLNQFQKLTKNLQALRKPLANTSLMSHIQGFRAAKHDSADSSAVNKSKMTLKNYVSKSLNSSPINTNSLNPGVSRHAGKKADDGENGVKHVPNKIFNFGFNNQKSRCNSDINLSWNLDISSVEKYQSSDNGNVTNDIVDDKTDYQVTNSSSCTKESYARKRDSKNDLNDTGREISPTGLPRSSKSKLVSYSASSTPVKLKNSSNLPPSAKSLHEKSQDDTNRYSALKALENKTASIKELPLLSLFEKTNNPLANSKSKSCSLINLDDKQNLMLLLDHSHLNDIQAVSAERLASARDHLFSKVPR